MKRTIYSLLSMAFMCAMTLTSCDEIMSSMDNPVDSYLKVDAEVFVKEGSAVELYAETISDAEVTYTVGDEKIAKVEKVSNHEVKVIGVKPGETVINVKLAANEYYKAGEAKVKVVVDPTYTLKDAVVAGAKLKIGYKLNGKDCLLAYEYDADKKVFNLLDENSTIPEGYSFFLNYNGDDKITQYVFNANFKNVLLLNLYTGGSFDRIYKEPCEMKSLQVNNYEMLPYVPESVTPVDILTPGLLPDNMTVGDMGVYTIDITPANATNQVIKFTSSDANVISIDAAGNFEAKATGTATIKAEATDGTGKFVQHTITVATPTDLKTIILEPNIWDIDGARFAAYVWNGGLYKWYLFSKVNDKWTANIPSSYTGLILVRLNSTTEVSWDARWNQTYDIDFTTVADNSTFTITGWGPEYYSYYSVAIALSITSPVVGQVIGSDGKNYAFSSLPTGVTPLAKICYVSGNHGLALAMADEGVMMNWESAKTAAAAHQPAISSGGSWKLATQSEWDSMITAAGGYVALRDGFNSVGGTNLYSGYYWSSTESNSNEAQDYRFSTGKWSTSKKTYEDRVRACLAF